MESREAEALQNELKFIKKEKRKRSAAAGKADSDIFWNKKNNPKSNQPDE
jgi:hypothetical protein